MEGSNLFYALLGGFSFSLERICLQCERPGFDPWVGRISWKRERLPTPIFWPREFHGLYSSWGCKELDTTERLSLSLLHLHIRINIILDKRKAILFI